MEGYPYSTAASYPDSGSSSPRSRNNIDNNHSVTSWADQSPPSAPVKLMCSYGGRIQPRPYDNQLSYVGGDTKILAVVGRSIDLLPRHDLPPLLPLRRIIQRPPQVPAPRRRPRLPRLRHQRRPRPPDGRVRSSPPLQRQVGQEAAALPLPPPPITKTDRPTDRPTSAEAVHAPVTTTENRGPDYLSGLDKGFVPQPAVKVRDPAPEETLTESPQTEAGGEVRVIVAEDCQKF